MNAKERDAKYIAGTYARFPVVIKSGKGSLLYGEDGKEYIERKDLTSEEFYKLLDEAQGMPASG